jgi:hypothetical protein
MHVRLDVRGIVKQQIEHIVALMLVRPNDGGIDRDMVGHQRVGDHPLVQPRDCLANGQKTTLTVLKPSVTHPLLVA